MKQPEVVQMSISERDRQSLDSIEDRLARSAPGLASMLAMFSRLTADEEMPAREPLRRAPRDPRSRYAQAGRAGPGSRGRVCSGKVWRCLFGLSARRWLWAMAALALLATAVTLTRGIGNSACTVPVATACRHAHAPAQPGAWWTAGR